MVAKTRQSFYWHSQHFSLFPANIFFLTPKSNRNLKKYCGCLKIWVGCSDNTKNSGWGKDDPVQMIHGQKYGCTEFSTDHFEYQSGQVLEEGELCAPCFDHNSYWKRCQMTLAFPAPVRARHSGYGMLCLIFFLRIFCTLWSYCVLWLLGGWLLVTLALDLGCAVVGLHWSYTLEDNPWAR